MEVVALLSQGRTAAAQCGLFTYKSVPVIFEPPCILYIYIYIYIFTFVSLCNAAHAFNNIDILRMLAAICGWRVHMCMRACVLG